MNVFGRKRTARKSFPVPAVQVGSGRILHFGVRKDVKHLSDWGRLMTTGANRRGTLARAHRDLDAFMIGVETGLLVNESREMVATV
jgi:hypothetical protein